MAVRLETGSSLPNLYLGVVEVANVNIDPASPKLAEYCQRVSEQGKPRAESTSWLEQCQEIRQLLRHGKFKPTGRSKPAQEYLMRCIIQEGSLPQINGPVDLVNAVSVDFNLPISLLSVRKCSNELAVDRGRAGESFVFNSGGQVLELSDLITVYDRSHAARRPVGTPVKDSMAGKIESADTHLVAIIYAPESASAMQRCDQAKQQLADGFQDFCGATILSTR
jgi:DNA/RNA-binding domain of Phe-tRNA-synthetase-like protein